MAMTDLVLALTGASGSAYGVRLLEVLLRAGRTVHLSISPAAVEVAQRELGRSLRLDHFELADLLGDAAPSAGPGQVRYHHYRNFQAGIASGSFLTGGMAICPCSMGTVGSLAAGLADNLIERAADVMLKERRPLLLVPRETPLSAIHLENLLKLARAGAVILPPAPGFYGHPQSIDDLVYFVVARVLDQLGVAHELGPRWGSRRGAIHSIERT